jgi:diguanylate cyclase (GGDEF)-like protein
MQDLGDDPRVGRRRLSAIQGERGTPTVTSEDASVVSAQRLLKVASALSDGATRLHEQLRHLEPAERDAILDLVSEQVQEIIALWSDLVRGVVTTKAVPTDGSSAASDTAPARGASSFASQRQHRGGGDHPARLTTPEPEFDPPSSPEPVPVVTAPTVMPTPIHQSAPMQSAPMQSAPMPSSPVQSTEPTPMLRHAPTESGRDSDRLTRDELTGVLNRQAGFAALGRDIDRCRRSGERFVLGYLNVDRMKVVNDTRGSRAGDEILRKVTAALRATLRSYDVIARLGGDEFLFSLPGSDMSTAELRFKEFAAILSEEAPGSTASVGFADLHQHDTLDDLIAAAETAMLKGRRTRRRGRG